MAPPKKRIHEALSPAHLKAIGRVAAQWSSLELTLIWVLSKVTDIPLSTMLLLVGSQSTKQWCDMLIKITRDSKNFHSILARGPKPVQTELDILCAEIEDLRPLRNQIVHATWDPPTVRIGRLKAKDKAEGTGIKRNAGMLNVFQYSSLEMLKIANRIEAVEQAAFDWLNLRKKRLRLAAALKTGAGAPSPSPSPSNRLANLLKAPYP